MSDNPETPLSLERIYKAYFTELTRYVAAKFGAGPPDPEDVAQTAFQKFAAAFESKAIRNPRAFLYASARNIVIDHARRQKTHNAYIFDQTGGGEEKSDEISPERVLISKERVQIMREAIRAMPPDDRRVLLMHRLQSRTYLEIAQTTGMSESSVRRAVARAVERIDKALRSRGASSDQR